MIDFEKDLNSQQLKVVYDGDGPCLVLSGPGSGKTKTLVYRTAYLLNRGVNPSRIMLLTFTKKAAKEMIKRITDLSQSKSDNPCGGTFHHMGNIFLRKYADKIGYSPNFIIIDEEDSKSILNAIIKERGYENSPKAPVVKKIISLSINSKRSVADIIKSHFSYLGENHLESVEKIKDSYKERKKRDDVMDYDDLLFYWNEILEFDDIKKDISENFLYVLVDEYQDTNLIQEEIIKKVSEFHKNILAVGDDAQSIYSFRAADIKNILDFEKRYQKAKVFRLEKNYRSTPSIVSAANNVIKKNEEKLEKNLFSVKSDDLQPKILPFSNPSKQAEFIAQALEEAGNIEDTAVLFRAHHHAMELEMELARRGIPYILRGGVKFFEQFHIKDTLSFLRIFLNFRDESSWKRLLQRQEKVGEVTAQKVIKEIFKRENLNQLVEEKDKFFKNIRVSTIAHKSLKKLFDMLEKSNERSPEEKISIFIKDFYNEYLNLSFENAKERIGDLKRLNEITAEYRSLEDMLVDFSLSEDFQADEENRRGVVLSTVHQAKGLEWEKVFVISLKEGDFPHLKSVEEGMIEEERRLFYVAITRCKKNLFLTYPKYSVRDKYYSLPSRFLQEMKDESEYSYEEEIIEDEEEWEIF